MLDFSLTLQPYFVRTTPWLYKAFHLALVITAFREQTLLAETCSALAHGVALVLAICTLPSLLHAVRQRERTTHLIVQSVLMASALNIALHRAAAHRPDAVALLLQLLSGHVFYTLACTCLADRHLLLFGPLVSVACGTCAVVFPVLASLAGPRPADAEGLLLVACLCAGELCGLAVYCVAVCVWVVSVGYESLLRALVE